MTAEQEEIKRRLENEYECYILIGQKEEFGETDFYLQAHTTTILSMMEGAYKKYPALKEMIKNS